MANIERRASFRARTRLLSDEDNSLVSEEEEKKDPIYYRNHNQDEIFDEIDDIDYLNNYGIDESYHKSNKS